MTDSLNPKAATPGRVKKEWKEVVDTVGITSSTLKLALHQFKMAVIEEETDKMEVRNFSDKLLALLGISVSLGTGTVGFVGSLLSSLKHMDPNDYTGVVFWGLASAVFLIFSLFYFIKTAKLYIQKPNYGEKVYKTNVEDCLKEIQSQCNLQ